MPPRSRGSMRTSRSERRSAPECPAFPVRVSIAVVMESPPLNIASDFRELKGSGLFVVSARSLGYFGENCVRHLHRARGSLTDRLGSARNAHHVVSADGAFLHHCRDSLTDAAGLL